MTGKVLYCKLKYGYNGVWLIFYCAIHLGYFSLIDFTLQLKGSNNEK